MTLKLRLKSYSFWVSLASAIFLLLKVLGQRLGFSVDEGLYNDIFTTLCGILVICGIIAPPKGNEASTLPAPVKSSLAEQIVSPENGSESLAEPESKPEPTLETIIQNQPMTETKLDDNTDFEQSTQTQMAAIEIVSETECKVDGNDFQNYDNQIQGTPALITESQIVFDSVTTPNENNENGKGLQSEAEEAYHDNCNPSEIHPDCNQETFAAADENAGEDTQSLMSGSEENHFELFNGMDIPVSK